LSFNLQRADSLSKDFIINHLLNQELADEFLVFRPLCCKLAGGKIVRLDT
jgi:hypothetical protein